MSSWQLTVHYAWPAEPGGQGGRGPPKYFQNQYSGGLSSALASEGIKALPPPNIFIFHRP